MDWTNGSTLVRQLGDWSAGPGSLHRKLTTGLRAAINSGQLPPGARLPAERRLAQALAVSRSTVVAAYERLQGEGWIERRQGSGTRVRPDAGRRRLPRSGHVEGGTGAMIFQRLIDGEGEVISLACATNLGSAAVADAFAEVAAGDTDRLLRHSGYIPRGLPALRHALAAYLSRNGLASTDDEILITTGAHQALALAAALYVRPGDAVVVESPSFPGCLDVFRAAGARLRAVPIDREGIRPDQLDIALSSAKSELPVLLYIMPTYHNPAGTLLPEYRRRRVIEAAARAAVPILEDNALEGASLGAETPPPVAAFVGSDGTQVLTVGSLSKSLWAGLRVGWVRAPKEVIGRLVRLKAMSDLGSDLVAQAVAARLVPHLETHIEARSRQLQAGLHRLETGLRERLPDWHWDQPDGGPSLWVRLPRGDASTFAQVALRHGVEVVPGDTMAPDGGHRDRIRVPYCFEPALLDELINRLAATWSAYMMAGSAARNEPLPVVV
jgi:DNA-binding transcriptional MocR family regulator